jgi:hypothetical protein
MEIGKKVLMEIMGGENWKRNDRKNIRSQYHRWLKNNVALASEPGINASKIDF